MQKAIWAILCLTTTFEVHCALLNPNYVNINDLMKCSYGERGSLTATCVNATANYFRTTPYRFDQLDETLKCLNCSLQTLDSGVFDISGNQIRNLDLSRSQIETMRQKSFVGLIFLENLVLSYNHIKAIYPGTFMGVKKIKSVDISNNDLISLSDDGFLELVNLEKLSLDQNSIRTISSRAFNGLAKLKELNLKNNQINELKDSLYNLTSLEVLNLENNHLVTLNGLEFFNLTSLLELNLSFNKLQSPLIEVQPQSLLRSLYLQNNIIDRIAPSFLKGLHSLETLDLSYNQINEIAQKTLQNLYNLQHLNISYNKLTKFQTGTYSGLPQLELLNCSHNTILDIEITGVFSLHSLHSLDLSFNTISDVDYVGLISRLPRLSYLKLDNNILPCDLEDEMTAYFAEDNFKFVLYDNSVGAVKCVNTPTKKTAKVIPDLLIQEIKQSEDGATGAEITIIVLMCIVFVCVGFLFYLQFHFYQEIGRPPRVRATSSAHLIEGENRETDDFLRE